MILLSFEWKGSPMESLFLVFINAKANTHMMQEKKPFILMLEHDDDDRFITETFFKEHKFDIDVHFVVSNDELILYLNGCKIIGYPSVILLNLTLTSPAALTILKQLKTSSEFNHIPVIILSGMNNEIIVKQCYSIGASSYIQKPDSLELSNKKILNFLNYWFETVEL
jgi:CheY-like chemotaxis protein